MFSNILAVMLFIVIAEKDVLINEKCLVNRRNRPAIKVAGK